ncbi:unnamed protein product [Moneuplotes crassus]|uniref:Uncharacterized protein n=1 Tax=Euplotes crassus TaxID=5936 RepID=A0AAD1UBY4_EUPCR|nr:unnamed protein product [Moneuplotes crassus]
MSSIVCNPLLDSQKDSDTLNTNSDYCEEDDGYESSPKEIVRKVSFLNFIQAAQDVHRNHCAEKENAQLNNQAFKRSRQPTFGEKCDLNLSEESCYEHSLTKGKNSDTSCVPSVIGQNVELSFVSPVAEDINVMNNLPNVPPKFIPKNFNQPPNQGITVVQRSKVRYQEEDLFCDEELSKELISQDNYIQSEQDYNEYLENFHNLIHNDSENFGKISNISQYDQKLKSGEKTDFHDEVDDFIRCPFAYNDQSYETSNFELDQESFREDTPTEDLDCDEDCKPNCLPVLKIPRAFSINKSEIPTEKDVFDVEWSQFGKNLPEKSPVINKFMNMEFRSITPNTKGMLNQPKTRKNSDEKLYFTFRKSSTDSYHRPVPSRIAIPPKLNRNEGNIKIEETPVNHNKDNKFSLINRTPESLSKMSPMMKKSYPKLYQNSIENSSKKTRNLQNQNSLYSLNPRQNSSKIKFCFPQRTNTLCISSSLRPAFKRLRLSQIKNNVISNLK